ncbi:MAG: hypothetical protein JRI55_18535 [Deltaproteobacteria bacterium]|nr:hypothetical protein [Deltaproteobacteria bacterium]
MSPHEPGRSRKLLAVTAYVAAAMSGAVGQFCFKRFAAAIGDAVGLELALDPYLWVAMAAYFGVMALFIVGLKLWGELSALYPVYGSTFVFALAIAWIWLDERIAATGFLVTALIIVGITLLSAGSTAGRGQG